MESGTSNIPDMASTNARPLKSTARPAVAPDPAIASSSERRAALLAVARDDEEAVVRGDRETHDRGHLEQEHGQVEDLAEEGASPRAIAIEKSATTRGTWPRRPPRRRARE